MRLVGLWVLICLFIGPSAAFAKDSAVTIDASNTGQFIQVARISARTFVYCRLSRIKNTLGQVTRGNKRVFRSYSSLITSLSKKTQTTFILAKIVRLKQHRARYSRICRALVVAPIPTAIPTTVVTSSITPVATITPPVTPQQSPSPTMSASPSFSPSPTPTPAPLTRLSLWSGGVDYIDSASDTWVPDAAFVSGASSIYSSGITIQDTNDQAIYQSERFGSNFSYHIPVTNGPYQVSLHFAEIYWSDAGKRVFDVSVNNSPLLTNYDIFGEVGAARAVIKTTEFTVTNGFIDITLSATVNYAKISGITIRPHEGSSVLHAVITSPNSAIDFDRDGSVDFSLDGTSSHTHEIGHSISGWEWFDYGGYIGSNAILTLPLVVGHHPMTLRISDDNSPPQLLTKNFPLDIYALDHVGGVLVNYYKVNSGTLQDYIDSVPLEPDYVERRDNFSVNLLNGKFGGSSFSTDTVVVLTGMIEIDTAGTYNFEAVGGSISRLFVDGSPVSSALALTPGAHSVELRLGLSSPVDLPAVLKMSLDAGPLLPIDPNLVDHDQSSIRPFIQSMPTTGSSQGGEVIEIKGIGFFPENSLGVHWGSTSYPGISAVQGVIHFTTPPGTGTVQLSVQTPNGISNQLPFNYDLSVPITFDVPSTIATIVAPTQAAWGPDGRLYVGSVTGKISIYSFDDHYQITAVQEVSTVEGLNNYSILGIGFNPFDPPTPVKIYISHGELFASNGGGCPDGPVPYSGQVSILAGPDFATVTPLITGLPVSNHDHSVNGLSFDNYGSLFVSIGGQSNAGIANCNMGGIPESPLSAAIIKADISTSDFNGSVSYSDRFTGLPSTDERFGDTATAVLQGISVYASGFRNSFDNVFTTEDNIYLTDNGPNAILGVASLSATTQGPEPGPEYPDEVNLLVEGNYYGHPNRSRGFLDPRQNGYIPPIVSSNRGQYSAPMVSDPPLPSTNGIDQYRSQTFQGELNGALIAKRFGGLGDVYAIFLGAAANSVRSLKTVAMMHGVDIVFSPGGALIATDYNAGTLQLIRPQDPDSTNTKALDIFPWRALPTGNVPFKVTGTKFGTLADTSVSFGGNPATVTSVSTSSINGTIPAIANPTADLVDITISSNGTNSLLPKAFRYIFTPGQGRGVWTDGVSLPTTLGEVAAGAINGVIYLLGSGDTRTFGYDIQSEHWFTNLAKRPYLGNHHGAEVIGSQLYLFGGLGGNSENKVQIFDPESNSWSLGANIPVGSGAASTAYINGIVYYAGGISGSSTISQLQVYDPESDLWTVLGNMPVPRNHTAAGTDGAKFYIFGGRGPGSGDANEVAIGFDDVQIYDPILNSWQTSFDPGSPIPPLPQKRGGMGKAVYFRNEFYIIGGETTPTGTGQESGNVYNRVDVYNPLTKSWRLNSPIHHPRHGIFPVLHDRKIFLAAGGITAGESSSSVMELFHD